MRLPIPVRDRRVVGARQLSRLGDWSWLGTAAVVPVVVGALAGAAPGRLRLSTTPGVLHLLSFRGPAAIGLGLGGAAALVSAGINRPRRAGAVPWRRLTVGVAAVVGAAGHAATLARRGWATRPITGRAELVVISLNTLGGAATPRQIADLVLAELSAADAAVVALPETVESLARQCAELLETAGHRFQVLCTTVDGANPLSSTSLLIDDRLGAYRSVPAPQLFLGAVVAEPLQGAGLVLAAVHPGAPMPQVGFRRWRRDVTATVALARNARPSIVAGDFNTTVDHEMMSDLRPAFDAATRAGRGAEGTWPARFPVALAAPIDHVLVNGDLTVLGSRAVRVGGSDHRALVVRFSGLDRAVSGGWQSVPTPA